MRIPPSRFGRRWRLAIAVLMLALGLSEAPAEAQVPLGGSPEARALLAAQEEYEAKRKSVGWALGLEVLAPGLGNAYAGETEEALLTWTGLLIGAFFLADGYGLTCEVFNGGGANCPTKTFYVVQGWIFLGGSRLFGLASAPLNVHRNNRALRAKLGLDAPFLLGVAPWGQADAGGLSLALWH
ncbi:MAG: hypothetical protein KA712_19680 [Myxococcales bacterium]|nr:hypothetical protein [Myxococcales bacterium]